MPTDPAPVPPPRWRIDAVAVSLGSLGILLALGLVTSPNWFGAWGDWFAGRLLDALGLGVGVLLAGWFTSVGLYVARRSWLRLGIRALGWVILTAAASALADKVSPGNLSIFGPGGSVGAWVCFQLDSFAPFPIPGLLLGGWILLGAVLAFDALVRAGLRSALATSRVAGRSLVRGNAMVSRGTGALIRKLTPPAKPALVRLTQAPTPGIAISADIPITRPAPLPEVEGPVPIHRHTERAATNQATPLPFRLVPRDDEDEIEEPRSNLPEGYELPSLALLADADPFPVADHEQKLRERAALLEKTFLDFGIVVRVVGIHTGPVITQYEIALETGLRLNKVTVLADDIALNLGVQSVRIVASIPGRNTVGVEVPNEHRQTVRLKEIIQATTAKTAKFKLPIYLGKDVEGRPLVYDMATMPHLLIAGRTGTGKSVCLNSIIQSFLFSRAPDECRLILIDPKKVEFSDYARIPHLMHPVVTDDKKSEAILSWAVDKMEERYELLRRARVRNIASYNELTYDEILKRVDPQSEDERRQIPRKMPYIVVIVDEVGDLLMSMKKEVEGHIIRLAQKSRASGIHLILATQRPTVDVITGLIKSNLPARICFQVASRNDSMVVLDEKGADKLLGMGDMLFLQPGTSTIVRGQGAYVDDKEIERVMEELGQYEPNFESELLNLKAKDTVNGGDAGEKMRDRDALYEQAIEVVLREQRGSTSLLQRALGIGYGRASRLIDFMAEDGIVGSFNGSSAREVLLTSEDWEIRKRA